MLLFGGAFGLVAFAVWVFCIIDVITTPAGQPRNLPKLAWLLIVIFLIDLGSIAWLIAGRPWHQRVGARAAARPMSPDDDDEFLAGLQARAEEQRRRAREQEDPPAA